MIKQDTFASYHQNKELNATGFVNPKATALFFDRVWIPCDVTKYDMKDFKTISKLIKRDSIGFYENFYLSYDYGALAYMGACELNRGFKFLEAGNSSEIEYYTTYHRNMAIRVYALSVKKRYNIDVVPVYLDSNAFDEEAETIYENAESKVISICIDNFPQISEDKLTWEQVLNYKRDKDSVNALHRFQRWIRLELKNKSRDEIEDTILADLDDYKFSLKKHGIMTVTGAISTIVSAVPSIFEAIYGKTNYMPTSISLAAGISIYTIDKTIELFEKKREPIAFIYDLIK